MTEATVHENPWFSIVHKQVPIPDREPQNYYMVEKPDSILVVPQLSDSGQFLLLSVERPNLANRRGLEFPQGGIEAGETATQAAQRELREETGAEGANWSKTGVFSESNGYSTAMCHVFCTTITGWATPEREIGEESMINVVLTANDIREAIKSGDAPDGYRRTVMAGRGPITRVDYSGETMVDIRDASGAWHRLEVGHSGLVASITKLTPDEVDTKEMGQSR